MEDFIGLLYTTFQNTEIFSTYGEAEISGLINRLYRIEDEIEKLPDGEARRLYCRILDVCNGLAKHN